MEKKNRSALLSYGLAAALTGVALVLRLAGESYLGEKVPFITFFPAVFLTAWLTSLGPTLFAVALSAVFAGRFFLPPEDTWIPGDAPGWLALGLFMSFGLGTALVGEGTRRKNDRLRQEGERFSVTLSSIGDGVIVTDEHGKVSFLNPVAEELTGWTLADAREKPLEAIFEIVNEQTLKPVENPAAKTLREGRIVGLANHTILIAKDGTRRAIDDSAAPIREPEGEIAGAVLVFRDVSDQRAAQIARGRLAALVDSSDDAIIGQTFEGVVTDWNAGAEKLFGFTSEEAVGRPIFSTIVPADRKQELLEVLGRIREGKHTEQYETLRQCKDGRRIPDEIRVSPIRDAHGEIVGASAIDRDISARRAAERRRTARLAINQTLAQAPAPEDAIQEILATLCSALGWDAACYWRRDPVEGVLRCRQFRQQSSRNLDAFRAITLELALKPGEGLPGRVWNSGQAIWTPDLMADREFARAQQAAEVGLHSGFACPVAVGEQFLGVVECFGHAIARPDEDLLEMMATMGGQIGQVIERREAERRLRESELELSDFFDNAAVGLHWVGPDGTILRVNQAELDMLGYDRDEYLGRNIADFHVDQPVIADILTRLTEGRQLRDYEARLRCKDGSIRYVLLDSNAYSKDGQFIHSRCFTRDVTERRRAEWAVRETEERLRLALKAGRLGAWEWRIATGEVIWSPTLEALHGVEPGSFPGTFDAFQRDIHPEDRDRVLDAVRQTVEGVREHHLEYRIIWPDGSIHWLEARGELFRDQAGRPLRLSGVCSDITERKRIEESLWFLAEASKSLSAVVDYKSTLQKVANLAVPRFADWCAVDMLGEDGSLERVVVTHVDPAKVALAEELHRRYPGDTARRVLDRSESELTTRITDSMIEQAAQDEEHLQLLRDLQLRSYMCIPLRTKERSLGVISFAFAESGRLYGQNELAIAEDLAGRAAIAVENARLYQELREADRRKDEFLAMLAHELRNPLAPIRSGLEIMSMDQSDHHEIIQLMQEQVEHVVRLVDDLLDVSRVVRGRIELRRESVELAPVVRRSVKAVQRLVEGRNQELAVSMPTEPIWLTADPVRIVQVLENLLNNASKYSDAGARIELSVERQGGEAVIQVHDTGMGIEPELLPHIFDLFTQSPRSLDRSQGGLGIGLTLTQRLVEMHDGTIDAASEGPGKGSTFTVRLPVTEKTAKPARDAKQTHTSPGRRILIVDDNLGAAHMLSLLLSELDHEVIETANDGPTALERIEEMRPEVILLDIGLPGMDGYDVAREIRSKPDYDEVLLVCLTGYGQYEDRLKSKEAGFDLHLVKPPSLAQIREVLSHPKLTRAGT